MASVTGFKSPGKSAYGTWISEIMLQQTQVATVIPYWLKWMERFPTIESLASATGDEVNAMWAGLGYYRRAQQLLLGAKNIMRNFKGIIPSDVENLKRIEGIGPYTAGAISSIAFGQVEPLVDGNVIRVLSRLYALKEYAATLPMEKVSWSIAKKLVDLEHPGDFNQGLMELGATVCSPTFPNCDDCPLRDMCKARIIIEYSNDKNINAKDINEENSHVTGEKTLKSKRKINPIILQHEIIEKENKSEPAENLDSRGYPLNISYFPQKIKKKRAKEINVLVKVFVRNEAKNENERLDVKKAQYLFIRRPAKGLLANQWEFPSVISEEDRGSIESGADFHLYLKSISLFMKNTMGVNWNINDENFQTKNNAISNVKQTCDTNDNQNIIVKSGKQKIANLKKNLTTIKNDENDTLEGTVKSEINHDIAIDNNKVDKLVLSEINQNLELIGLSPIVILTPVEHIFSHQKHFMNIFYSRFKINDNHNNNNDDDYNVKNEKNNKKNKSKTVHENIDELSWTSLCGQNREIKWMSAQEITEAGITTGCKKILTEVLKQKLT